MDTPGAGGAPAEEATQARTEAAAMAMAMAMAAPATAGHPMGRLSTLRLDELRCVWSHLAPIALERLICTCKAMQQAISEEDDWRWLKSRRRHLVCMEAGLTRNYFWSNVATSLSKHFLRDRAASETIIGRMWPLL